MADIRSLEHPTLKVPYELLNKKFRYVTYVALCHLTLHSINLQTYKKKLPFKDRL